MNDRDDYGVYGSGLGWVGHLLQEWKGKDGFGVGGTRIVCCGTNMNRHLFVCIHAKQRINTETYLHVPACYFHVCRRHRTHRAGSRVAVVAVVVDAVAVVTLIVYSALVEAEILMQQPLNHYLNGKVGFSPSFPLTSTVACRNMLKPMPDVASL